MRILMGLGVLLMMVPTFLMLAGPLHSPMMFDGDTLQKRTCPACHGTGPKCRRCHGTGTIDFIVPGPGRPTYLIGHVYAPDQLPVPGANVTIETSAGNYNVHSDETGRFGTTLPPGSYPLTITTPKGKLQEPLVIEKQTTEVPADEAVTLPAQDRAFQLTN